ncbi:MAG: calcium-binding protein [Solirubrobacterales bacterium]
MTFRRARGILAGLALAAAGVAVALAPSGVVAVAAEEEVPTCHGKEATIVGTDGDDVLHGTPERDVIAGGAGDDEIYGALGSDVICGGPGSDLIHGGRGNDEVDGGPGQRDRVIGDLGDDKVLGGPGGYDEVAGDLGIDVVNGGAGDHDLVHGDYGWDRMSGGAGKGDIASFATNVAGGKGAGVWASLEAHKAFGDGHDKLFKFEALEGSAFADTLIGNKGANVIDGGAGDDKIFGGGGRDFLNGGQGSDGCKGAKGRTTSCGKEAPPNASAYVELNPTMSGGAGLQIVGGAGPDDFVLGFDEPSGTYVVTAAKGIATGPGCSRAAGVNDQVFCPAGGAPLWLTADLGPGDDTLRVEGSLAPIGNVRIAGGFGDDVIHGGPEDDLIEAGRGADKLYGHAGADGLVGGLPGPTYLYGGENGDLLAAGGGCAGGALVGGGGRDNASFAETQAHPGLLIISLPRRVAYVDAIKGCDRIRISPTNEQLEGSFDDDVIIGDRRDNSLLGQPGQDRFYGGGGDDVIDARDGVRDFVIQCGRGRSAGRALVDKIDPGTDKCAASKVGTPIPGLHG